MSERVFPTQCHSDRGRGNRGKSPLLLARLSRDDRFSNDGSHEEAILRAIPGRHAPLHPLQQHASGPVITGSFSSVNSLVNHSAQYPVGSGPVRVRVSSRGKRNCWHSNFLDDGPSRKSLVNSFADAIDTSLSFPSPSIQKVLDIPPPRLELSLSF